MYIFNHGDIIIRIYNNGRTAIGMYDCNVTYNKFLYLGKTFIEDGGLRRFSHYSINNYYEYRLATYNEMKILLKDLSYNDYYYKIIKDYMNTTFEGIRLNKLKRLKTI